jgi:hypothetical protein
VQYRFAEMFQLYLEIKKSQQDAKFLLLVNDIGWAQTEMKMFLNNHLAEDIKIYNFTSENIHEYLEIADVGLCLRTSLPSMRHVAPLKFREYLLSGVPTIVSNNTADELEEFGKEIFIMPEMIESINVEIFTDWINAVRTDRNTMRAVCRNRAKTKFNICHDIQTLKSVL